MRFSPLTFSSIQTLLNYSTTTLTARNDPGTERDGWNFGMECFGRLRLGRVGIMMDYGSTHDGRTETVWFCFVLVASESASLNEWLSEPIGLLIRPRLCYAMDRTGQIRFSHCC
jgi:hypothetical protein